jgi:hypothetical protein
VDLSITLTAPAPTGGLEIRLQIPPEAVDGNPPTSLAVPGGQNQIQVSVALLAVAKLRSFTFVAFDPIGQAADPVIVDVAPPFVESVAFVTWRFGVPQNTTSISGVALGGVQVSVSVHLSGAMPSSGMTYPISYQGTTDITGPSQISPGPGTSAGGPMVDFFDVTVGPCGVNPPCFIEVRVGPPGAQKSARLTVNP